jgi:hypothetical protein
MNPFRRERMISPCWHDLLPQALSAKRRAQNDAVKRVLFPGAAE